MPAEKTPAEKPAKKPRTQPARTGVVDTVTTYHVARSHDKLDQILWRMSLVAKVFIVLAMIFSIATGEMFLITSGAVALFFMFVPAMIERRWKVHLPVELDLFVTLFLLVHFVIGEIINAYELLPWFDFVLHGSSGIVLALLGFLIIYTFLAMNKIQAKPVFIFLFTISLALGLGALWEIYEFGMDQLLGFNMQKSGLVDTMWDLIATLIGAIIVSFLGYRYLKRKKKEGIIHRFVKKVLLIYEQNRQA